MPKTNSNEISTTFPKDKNDNSYIWEYSRKKNQIFVMYKFARGNKSFLCFIFSFIMKLNLLWKIQLKALDRNPNKRSIVCSKSCNLKGLKTFRGVSTFRNAKTNREAHTKTTLVTGCYPFRVVGLKSITKTCNQKILFAIFKTIMTETKTLLQIFKFSQVKKSPFYFNIL